MSYVRWSSEDFASDVYVYRDFEDKWVTHVTRGRYVSEEPMPPQVDVNDIDAWIERHRRVMDIIHRSRLERIDLPYAGESFYDSTISECIDRLENLRSLGYYVPQFALDNLRDDMEYMEEENDDLDS